MNWPPFFVVTHARFFGSASFASRALTLCPHQVFVGKIPRDLYEDELVPLFESAGAVWDLRLMMDPLSGQNRGYAFITYCNKDDAQKAVKLVSTSKRCRNNREFWKSGSDFTAMAILQIPLNLNLCFGSEV